MDTRPTDVADRDELPRGVGRLGEPGQGGRVSDGEEALDLITLAAAGVPLAPGLVVDLGGREARARLVEVVSRFAGSGEASKTVRVRPLFPTRTLASRLASRGRLKVDVSVDAANPREIRARIAAFFDDLCASEVTESLGGSLDQLQVRVLHVDESPSGWAASADPQSGDPDHLRVWESAAVPWIVDRRSARVLSSGAGGLDDASASRVADFADRAQLALGVPVEIEWCRSGGRLAVVGVRPLALRPAFTPTPFRIVALIADDEGTVAPLSVDCLDKALRPADDPSDEAAVRRIYGRPYRRIDDRSRVMRRRADPAGIAKATAHAVAVAADVMAPLSAVRRFEGSLRERLDGLDAVDLGALDDTMLEVHLRERQLLVVEAMALLDHLRIATIGGLTALEAAVGSLPADCFPALSRPRPTRKRRRDLDRLAGFAGRVERELGALAPHDRLSASLRRRFDALRRDLSRVRPLGLDMRPLAWGHDDARLLAVLRAAPWKRHAAQERARRSAIRRLMATARARPLGRARVVLIRSLLALLGRLAVAKGHGADSLADVALRLRDVACEAGRRLVGAGLVDEPEDALYMHVAEIGQGLAGEPGAYAARVRLRREDDQRWFHFEAPRRLDRRHRGPGALDPPSSGT